MGLRASLYMARRLQLWFSGTLVIRIDGRGRHPAVWRGGINKFKVRAFVPRSTNILTMRQVEDQLNRIIRRDVAKERIVKLTHRVQRFHKHSRVGDLAGQQMRQRLNGALVVTRLDQRLIGLTCAGFSRDVGA